MLLGSMSKFICEKICQISLLVCINSQRYLNIRFDWVALGMKKYVKSIFLALLSPDHYVKNLRLGFFASF